MKKKIKTVICLFATLFMVGSCTEDVDFDQLDEIEIVPTAEAGLLYVEAPESAINLVPPGNFFIEDFNFDAFSEEYVAERLVDGVVTYEVENTTSKQLNIVVEFLDASGNVLDTEQFLVDPTPTSILQREIFYGGATGRSLSIITNASAIRVTATNLSDNTSVSSEPDPNIYLRSSVQFRIRIR